MADASLGSAVLRARLDTSGLKAGLNTAQADTEKAVKSMDARLKSLGSSLTRTGRTLTIGLTAPLVAAGAGIVALSGDFEKSMNRVRALSGATGQDFEKLRKQARQLGADTQFSASEAADAMSFLAMAGFETQQIYASMPDTLNLAAAAQLDMGSAADIVSNIMTGFGIQTDKLGNAVDVLSKAFISSNTDLRMLGEGMKFVGPVSSGLGVSFEETTAALGALSNAGIQGGMAGTSLRRILSTLASEADKLGIATTDSAGTMRPLADIIDELNARGMTTTDTLAIFGERGGPAMSALLAQGGQALRDFTTELENAGGTAEDVAKTQMEGLHGMVKELQSAGEELALSLGDAGLLGAAKGLTTGLTNLVRWFNELPPSAKTATVVLGGIAAAIGPLTLGIGTLLVQLPKVAAGLQLLRTGGLAAFGPLGWVALGTTAIVGLVAVMAGREGRRKDSLVAAMEDTAKAAKDIENPVQQVGTAFDNLATNLRGNALQAFTEIRGELAALVADSENAAEALLKIQLGTQLTGMFATTFGNVNVRAALNAAGASMYGDRRIQGAESQVTALLQRGQFEEAVTFLDQVITVLESGGTVATNALAEVQDFRQLVVDARELAARTFGGGTVPTGAGAVPGAPGAPGSTLPGATPGGVTPQAVRTAQDVWTELGDLGLHAINVSKRLIASGVDQAEATISQLEERRSLLTRARSELLRDFYDDVTDAELAYLQRRISEVDAELAALRATPRAPYGGIVGLPDALDVASERLDAEAEELGASLARSLSVGAAREQMQINARNRAAARAIAADTEQAMADAAAAHEEYLVAIGHTDAELARFKSNAAGLAAVLKEAADQSARMEVFAAAQARYGIGDTGLAGTSASARGGIGITREQLNAQAADVARDTVRAITDAYLAGAGSIEDVQFAVNALTTITPMSVLAINDLTEGVLALERAAAVTEQRMAAIRAFDESPGSVDASMFPRFLTPEQRAFNERMSARAHRPRETGESDKEFIAASKEAGAEVRMAGHEFALMTINAGQGFLNAVESFRAGDVGGGIAGLGSTIGGLTTALGGLGGSLASIGPWGAVISAGAGLLGGIVNLFSGDSRDAEERRRREQQATRSVPAINITFTVQQQNTYNGAPSDPRNEQAFARQADALFESLYKRHLGPRLDSIERRLGMTGAGA